VKIVIIFTSKLFACWNSDFDTDEFTLQFRKWNDTEQLLDFFTANENDLRNPIWNNISIERAIFKTIYDAAELQEYFLKTEARQLDHKFRFLDDRQISSKLLDKSKCYGMEHPSWLRLYAILIEPQVYVITGGAIKLTHTMSERIHTKMELVKLDQARNYLLKEGVIDKEGMNDLMEFQL